MDRLIRKTKNVKWCGMCEAYQNEGRGKYCPHHLIARGVGISILMAMFYKENSGHLTANEQDLLLKVTGLYHQPEIPF